MTNSDKYSIDTDDLARDKSYSRHVQSEDLEKIISLAEEVSHHVQDMDSKVGNLKQRMIITIAVLYTTAIAVYLYFEMLNLSNSGSYILTFAGLLLLAFATTSFSLVNRNIRKLKANIEVETAVLRELLDLASEMETASRRRSLVDPISIATFRMRLKRLHFSVQK
ncbi:hypothetical protein [Vibrio coralliirubri]|uniref:hypothetical protein n=1 Tax=Vibrio coralliirubri TaxID=1516159 RepID=UPI0021C2AB22|nr:hypothetical protein [Vibrio coralliirubri]